MCQNAQQSDGNFNIRNNFHHEEVNIYLQKERQD